MKKKGLKFDMLQLKSQNVTFMIFLYTITRMAGGADETKIDSNTMTNVSYQLGSVADLNL